MTVTTSGLVYRFETKIPDLVLFLVITVAAGSFLLSYVALMEAATRAGIPAYLAPAFPLTVDAFLAIGTLTILRNSLRGESPLKGWAVLVSFTMVSIGLNVAVGEYTPLSIVCHALPPAALAISLELFTGFIRSDLTRPCMNTSDTDAHPGQTVHEELPVRACTPDNITIPGCDQHEEEQDIPAVVSDPDEDRLPVGTQVVSDDEIIEVFNTSPGISFTQAAEELGCSRSTVSRRVKTLVEKGFLMPEVIPGYLLSIKTSEPVQPA